MYLVKTGPVCPLKLFRKLFYTLRVLSLLWVFRSSSISHTGSRFQPAGGAIKIIYRGADQILLSQQKYIGLFYPKGLGSVERLEKLGYGKNWRVRACQRYTYAAEYLSGVWYPILAWVRERRLASSNYIDRLIWNTQLADDIWAVDHTLLAVYVTWEYALTSSW